VAPPVNELDPQFARQAVRRGLITAAVVAALIVLALVAAAKTETGAEAVSDLADRMRPAALAGAFGLMSLAFVAMAFRWRSLMPREHRPPARGLTVIICAGLLLNYAVPGPFGELAAAWFARRRYGIPMTDALASGVTARLVGLATAAMMATSVWALTDLPIPPSYSALVAAAAIVTGLGGVALIGLAARPTWWKALAGAIADRAPATGRLRAIVDRGNEAVAGLADSLANVLRRGWRAWLAAAGWSMASHTTVTAGIIVGVMGLGRAPELAGIAFTYAMTTAGAVALFALPGSQVGWDAMFGTLLVATADLTLPDAVAIAVLVRLQQLSFMVVGALAVAWLLQTTADPLRPKPS
jgi:hypothetical protein